MSDHAHEPAKNDFATLSAPGTLPILDNIFQVSDKFLGQLKLYLEQHPPSTPISSILGFSQFTAQSSTFVTTREGTTSTSYANLATDGPSITGLPDGRYVVFITCWSDTSNATYACYASVSVNGAAPSDNDAAISGTLTSQSVLGASLQTLSAGGNNSLKMQYKSANVAATASFANRRIIALRYANK